MTTYYHYTIFDDLPQHWRGPKWIWQVTQHTYTHTPPCSGTCLPEPCAKPQLQILHHWTDQELLSGRSELTTLESIGVAWTWSYTNTFKTLYSSLGDLSEKGTIAGFSDSLFLNRNLPLFWPSYRNVGELIALSLQNNFIQALNIQKTPWQEVVTLLFVIYSNFRNGK